MVCSLACILVSRGGSSGGGCVLLPTLPCTLELHKRARRSPERRTRNWVHYSRGLARQRGHQIQILQPVESKIEPLIENYLRVFSS